jgi:hypothetical protein
MTIRPNKPDNKKENPNGTRININTSIRTKPNIPIVSLSSVTVLPPDLQFIAAWMKHQFPFFISSAIMSRCSVRDLWRKIRTKFLIENIKLAKNPMAKKNLNGKRGTSNVGVTFPDFNPIIPPWYPCQTNMKKRNVHTMPANTRNIYCPREGNLSYRESTLMWSSKAVVTTMPQPKSMTIKISIISIVPRTGLLKKYLPTTSEPVRSPIQTTDATPTYDIMAKTLFNMFAS